MKKLAKQQVVAEHNAKYEARLKQRKISERYVNLLKAPKANGNETS